MSSTTNVSDSTPQRLSPATGVLSVPWVADALKDTKWRADAAQVFKSLCDAGIETEQNVRDASSETLRDHGIIGLMRDVIKKKAEAPAPGLALGSGAINQDVDLSVALSAVLAEVDFPVFLDDQGLKLLLQEDITPIYSSSVHLQPFTSPVSKVCNTQLSSFYENAIRAPMPKSDASEMVWSGWWDGFAFRLIDFARHTDIFRDVTWDRNVQDESVTTPASRRDLCCWARRVLLFCGEEKAKSQDFGEAKAELTEKTQGFCSTTYGRLRYIFCYAAAGPKIAFYALDIRNTPCLKLISSEYDLTNPVDRLGALKCFINIFRWIRSVLMQGVLASNNLLRLGEAVSRPCPYSQPTEGVFLPEGYITQYKKYVKKVFFLPVRHYNSWQAVYAYLATAGACSFQSYIKDVTATLQKDDKFSSRKKLITTEFFDEMMIKQLGVWIQLQISPIAAQIIPHTEADIKDCFHAILTCLRELHNRGFVHRDLRWPNILRSDEGWMVIDFELAGEINSVVFWDNGIMPADVRNKSRGYTVQDELLQVGCLLKSTKPPLHWNSLISELGISILSASEALEHLRRVQ